MRSGAAAWMLEDTHPERKSDRNCSGVGLLAAGETVVRRRSSDPARTYLTPFLLSCTRQYTVHAMPAIMRAMNSHFAMSR